MPGAVGGEDSPAPGSDFEGDAGRRSLPAARGIEQEERRHEPVAVGELREVEVGTGWQRSGGYDRQSCELAGSGSQLHGSGRERASLDHQGSLEVP